MKITPQFFEAFVHCPTKCWLKSTGEHGAGNAYAEWVVEQNEKYQAASIDELRSRATPGDYVTSPPVNSLKEAKWRLAFDVVAQTEKLESRISMVERVPAEGRGRPAQFIPGRFIFRNKLTREDKLLVAFDAMVLSDALGREVVVGKIIHGDDHAMLKVKVPAIKAQVQKMVGKGIELLSGAPPPDLVLNRHCQECEYRDRCRQKAIEKDDLSLLAGMTAEERKEFNQKGIFTVTQLSYTFRPRRRPKHLRDKRERYHHSLKALAVREKKIYVVGQPTLTIEGTPVYLDVESLPDQGFYYLIGARVKGPDGFIQHSFWANDARDELRIWKEFLALLARVENPCLIHYGSFERTFLKHMCERHGNPPAEAVAVLKAIDNPVNLLSTIFAQVYLPGFSNSLKDVAGFLGFKWSEPNASGLLSVTWRQAWESSRLEDLKERIVRYNAQDCEALVIVEEAISLVNRNKNQTDAAAFHGPEVIRTDELRHPLVNRWSAFKSPIQELEVITNAAHWDYQHERAYIRSGKRPRKSLTKAERDRNDIRHPDKIVRVQGSNKCPECLRKGIPQEVENRIQHEIILGRSSVKRRLIHYQYQPFWCKRCNVLFNLDPALQGSGPQSKYGRSLMCYFLYHTIELCIPAQVVLRMFKRLYGLTLSVNRGNLFKGHAAEYYNVTCKHILAQILSGALVNADETFVSVRGLRAYIWILTNGKEVAYLYSKGRDGEMIKEVLGAFKGVLVSDFYAVYDSFACPQQKCLIHLIRDLNGVLLDNPYDEEVKELVRCFGELLRTIVGEIDKRGLKRRFLHKHLKAVRRFYREIINKEHRSPAASNCADRFRNNRNKLFTFLEHDGIPWHNNNAEHAVKAFARLRDVIQGSATEESIQEHLVLLSICQTCKYQGLDFLDFLCSGEKDIDVFAQRQ